MSHAGHNTVFDKDCTDCVLRYPKEYEHQTWLNFLKMDNVKEIDGVKYYLDVQEMLCKKYNITLLNYLTVKERKKIRWEETKLKWKNRWEKIKRFCGMINSGIDKIAKSKPGGINFSLGMSEKSYEGITGRTTSRDLDAITGRGQVPKMSYITGDQKKKPAMSYIIGKNQKKNNMSYIIGKNQKKSSMSMITSSNKKKPSMSHITRNKKKSSMSMITSKREKRNLSGLIGNSSRDLSALLGGKRKKQKGFSL